MEAPRGAYDGGSAARRVSAGAPPPRVSRKGIRDTPPRVFWKKRLDLLDCKGVDFFESAPFEAEGKKESAIV